MMPGFTNTSRRTFSLGALPWLLLAALLSACSCEPSPKPALAPQTTSRPVISAAQLEGEPTAWQFLNRRSTQSPKLLWFEAEDAVKTNFPRTNPFAPNTPEEASALSNGKWIGASKTKQTLHAEYKIELPHPGLYTLYARKFWRHGPFRWRFNDQKWKNCSSNQPLLDSVKLRKHVEANWVELGEIELVEGTHTFRLELDSNVHAAGFDAFVLSPGSFLPRGKHKPSKLLSTSEEDWFVFDPPLDNFSTSPIDLRVLNEKRSGTRGFIQVSKGSLRYPDSNESVRFWGNNAGLSLLEFSDAALSRYTRNLAKKGVNLLRLHGAMFDKKDFRKIKAGRVAQIQRLASSLRNEGIYLGLSIYFPVWLKLNESDGFAGYRGQKAFALQYFSQDFQKIYKGWWREILNTPNEEGSLPLGKDPTLAYIELTNEDSTLFWTFRPYDSIPEKQTILLERLFASWLEKRHGSAKTALEGWGGKAVRGDLPGEGRVGFLPLWNIGHDGSARARETAEFLARLMHDGYSDWSRYIKEELGYGGLTVCSNWHTANEERLGALDNWANTTCDIMDRHGYFSGKHTGEASSYATRKGHHYEDDSALIFELKAGKNTKEIQKFRLPFLEPRYNDKPAFVSELGWPWPNRFRNEGPLLTASYGALNGLDAAMFFASADLGWASSLRKFGVFDPAVAGQYPAAALIFRRNLVKEAEPLGRLSLPEKKLFSLEPLPFIGTPSIDSFRMKDIPSHILSLGKSLPKAGALTQLVGPVDFYLGEEANTSNDFATDPSPWLKQEQQTITSRTGELEWNYQRGLVRISTAQAEAALGFLGRAGLQAFTVLSANMQNEYASVALVALDNTPLLESNRMLLQIGTEAKNAGWSAPGTGLREIKSTGNAPVLVRKAEGSIQIKRQDAKELTITALDPNGTPLTKPLIGVEHVSLLPNVLYYLIEEPK